ARWVYCCRTRASPPGGALRGAGGGAPPASRRERENHEQRRGRGRPGWTAARVVERRPGGAARSWRIQACAPDRGVLRDLFGLGKGRKDEPKGLAESIAACCLDGRIRGRAPPCQASVRHPKNAVRTTGDAGPARRIPALVSAIQRRSVDDRAWDGDLTGDVSFLRSRPP